MNELEFRIRRVLAFRDLAAQELDAARLLTGQHGPQSAYFLQQSVEKLLRGVLEMLDVPAGPSHNISSRSADPAAGGVDGTFCRLGRVVGRFDTLPLSGSEGYRRVYRPGAAEEADRGRFGAERRIWSGADRLREK